MEHHQELSYTFIDQFSEAAVSGSLPETGVPDHTPSLLGPLLELRQLNRQQDAIRSADQAWLKESDCSQLSSHLDGKQPSWLSFGGRQVGFMRADYANANYEGKWIPFAQCAKRAAVASGLTGDLAGQLIGALEELLYNIIEHSQRPKSGFVAFAEGKGQFEIIVADEGIGVLKSLQSNDDYAYLEDHSAALTHFIKDGVSRSKKPGRGKGFQPLFKGLANAHCSIRFRSGDYALEIDGRQLSTAPSDLKQTTFLSGLFCSVLCHYNKPESFT